MTDKPPPSLLDLFSPPDNYDGVFGWICGYSADSYFMQEARQNFCNGGDRAISRNGKIALALMLNPTCPRIYDVPGVLHLPAEQNVFKAGKLQHAKVAILHYKAMEDNGSDIIRLIVSTGNWTTQTVMHSIDMFFSVDITADADDDDVGLADLQAAWNMMEELHKHYDLSLLKRADIPNILQEDGRLKKIMEDFAKSKKKSPPKSKKAPRFIDNRKSSLLEQISQSVQKHSSVQRNYIAMGSGFFESCNKELLPSVPKRILKKLEKILTKSAEVALIVNPHACQAISIGKKVIDDEGWVVLPAKTPDNIKNKNDESKTLHAKFIFSASQKGNGKKCLNDWTYFGSGNLTNPGIMHSFGKGGNLEAGVILFDQKLSWTSDVNKHDLYSDKLPFKKTEPPVETDSLKYRDEEPDFSPKFEAFYLPYLLWKKNIQGSGGKLFAPADYNIKNIEFKTLSGHWIKGEEYLNWPDKQPTSILARHEGIESMVQIIDEFGRIGNSYIRPPTLEETLENLVAFPSVLPDDDPDDEPDTNPPKNKDSNNNINRNSKYSGPNNLRPILRAIETIAEQQCQIEKNEWSAWCRRLGMALSDAGGSEFIQQFNAMETGMNIIEILLEPAFRPSFAETNISEEGRVYEETLENIRHLYSNMDSKQGNNHV